MPCHLHTFDDERDTIALEVFLRMVSQPDVQFFDSCAKDAFDAADVFMEVWRDRHPEHFEEDKEVSHAQ